MRIFRLLTLFILGVCLGLGFVESLNETPAAVVQEKGEEEMSDLEQRVLFLETELEKVKAELAAEVARGNAQDKRLKKLEEDIMWLAEALKQTGDRDYRILRGN